MLMRRVLHRAKQNRNFATLVLAARGEKGLELATANAVTAAKNFGGDMTVMVEEKFHKDNFDHFSTKFTQKSCFSIQNSKKNVLEIPQISF